MLDVEDSPSIEELDEIDSVASQSAVDKKNRPSTLQIATRERYFILETKNLVDTLDESLLNKFGELILFSDDLIKLGYGFQQDGKKLSYSFSIFKYRFVNFIEDVVNIDEVASEVICGSFICYRSGTVPLL